MSELLVLPPRSPAASGLIAVLPPYKNALTLTKIIKIIFFIFVRAVSPYFRKQPSECLSRQSVETEGMEDGRKLAY
jgi:hypothetical protein